MARRLQDCLAKHVLHFGSGMVLRKLHFTQSLNDRAFLHGCHLDVAGFQVTQHTAPQAQQKQQRPQPMRAPNYFFRS